MSNQTSFEAPRLALGYVTIWVILAGLIGSIIGAAGMWLYIVRAVGAGA